MSVAEMNLGEGDHDNADNEFGTDYLGSRTQYFRVLKRVLTLNIPLTAALCYFSGGLSQQLAVEKE